MDDKLLCGLAVDDFFTWRYVTSRDMGADPVATGRSGASGISLRMTRDRASSSGGGKRNSRPSYHDIVVCEAVPLKTLFFVFDLYRSRSEIAYVCE